MQYKDVQNIAKMTIQFIKENIQPGMTLIEIRDLCETKMIELGADSFWYWDVGAFVFAGDETTLSVSGKEYTTSERVIAENDIITIDLSPQNGDIWGDYARTIIIENGKVVEIDNAQVRMYLGNYKDYAMKKQQIRDAQLKEYMNQQREIKHQQAVI